MQGILFFLEEKGGKAAKRDHSGPTMKLRQRARAAVKRDRCGQAEEVHENSRRRARNGVVASRLEDVPCELCRRTGRTDTRHNLASLHLAAQEGLRVTPCFPPPLQHEPQTLFPDKRIVPKAPFLSLEGGRMKKVPNCLGEFLRMYCRPGAMFNLQISGENIEEERAARARHMLVRAEKDQEKFWAAFVVNDFLHPTWWPRTGKQKQKCCDDGDVPYYHQIIVGSGSTDIGMHMDNAPKPQHCRRTRRVYDMVDMDDPEYSTTACDGNNSALVDTWVTIARGSKLVVMLPPGGKVLQEDSAFPTGDDHLLLRKIIDAGGFYFRWEPVSEDQQVTLFVPKGWHHWVLGNSLWHVIFGASRF